MEAGRGFGRAVPTTTADARHKRGGLIRIDRMSLILRRKRAAATAKAVGVEALLVTHLPDVRWLSGFTGSNAALLLDSGRKGRNAGRAVLFTDGRYTTQAKAEAAGMKVVIAQRSAAIAAGEWLAEARIRRCGFDEGNTTVADLANLHKALPAALRRKMLSL